MFFQVFARDYRLMRVTQSLECKLQNRCSLTFAHLELDGKLDLFVCDLLTAATLVVDEALEV